jgi:hypothetical protein
MRSIAAFLLTAGALVLAAPASASTDIVAPTTLRIVVGTHGVVGGPKKERSQIDACLLEGGLDRREGGSGATRNGLSLSVRAEQAMPLVVVIVSLQTNVDVPLACVALEQVKHQ